MFVPGKDWGRARKLAQANANWARVPYVVFTDTSGNLRVERESVGPKNPELVETIYPEKLEDADVR